MLLRGAPPSLKWLDELKEGELAENEELIQVLKAFSMGGLWFNHIRIYKQYLNDRSGFLATEQQEDGSLRLPNIAGLVHHEGILLQLVDAQNVVSRFVKIEFGQNGLNFAICDQFPHLTDLIPDGDLKSSTIPRADGNPASLAKFLKSFTGIRYHCFKFNCLTFVNAVWDHYTSRCTFSL